MDCVYHGVVFDIVVPRSERESTEREREREHRERAQREG
jgi:hypothetical protein